MPTSSLPFPRLARACLPREPGPRRPASSTRAAWARQPIPWRLLAPTLALVLFAGSSPGDPARAKVEADDESTPAGRVMVPDHASPATVGEGPDLPNPDLVGPCADGAVRDDSSAETGYSWVPSVESGTYVQRFETGEIEPAGIDSVCVCWLRTRPDDVIDFEVVFHADDDGDGVPELEPFATFPARAADVPEGVTGRFYEVDTQGTAIPRDGPVYVGARWNPSQDQFFFVCADRSPETPFTEVFFRDDLAEGWGAASATLDSTFTEHRAILVRPVPRQPLAVEVPLHSPAGRGLLALALLVAGLLALGPLRGRG